MHRFINDPFPSKAPILSGSKDFYTSGSFLARLKDSLDIGNSVCLTGEFKAGKTSLLYHLLSWLSNEGRLAGYVDLQFVVPRKDKIALAHLARSVVTAIQTRYKLASPIELRTSTASDEECYTAFLEDLEELRKCLGACGASSFVWLIDELDILRGYATTELPMFLRPIIQNDPNFRMLAAGYDVFVLPSDKGPHWGQFIAGFGDFRRLIGLEGDAAKQLLNDAINMMQIDIMNDVPEQITAWTGCKPFYMKWFASVVARGINEQGYNHLLDSQVLQVAKGLFLRKPEIWHHFSHWWGALDKEQQTVLSLMICDPLHPNTRSDILNRMRVQELVSGDPNFEENLVFRLERLTQLGFLLKDQEIYKFTSGCLEDWIASNHRIGIRRDR